MTTEEDYSNLYDENSNKSLLDYWYTIAFSAELKSDSTLAISLFGEPLVLFRTIDRKVQCLQDRCAHRSAPLSIGVVENGHIECRYHGWTFGEGGKCIRVPSFEPSKPIPDYFKVPSYPAVEKNGIIFVWPGDPEKCSYDESEFGVFPNEPNLESFKYIEQYWDTNYSFDIMMENSLDPSHLQFAHEGQQGHIVGPRDINFPGAATPVRLEKVPGGFIGAIYDEKTATKTDYSIIFKYPNYTDAAIKNAKGEVIFYISTWVVPLSKSKSRLMFRMYRSFLKFVPDYIFTRYNNIIVEQDVVVLVGQQMRVNQGAPRWNIPVKADSLAVAFRKWWDNRNKDQKVWFDHFESTLKNPTVIRANIEDIEDMGREKVNPCVPCDIKVQPDSIQLIKNKLPELYPQQYKKTITTTSVTVALAALGVAVGVYLTYFN